MKILIITDKYVYDPRTLKALRRLEGIYSIEKPLREVLTAHGHTLDVFYFDDAIHSHGLEAARKKVWDYVQESKPDVCIPVGFDEYIYGKEFLQKMRDQKFTQFIYFGEDDAWTWARQGRHLGQYFQWVVTYDGRAVAKYKSVGCHNVAHHQPGIELEIFRKLEGRPKNIDVSFMGLWSKPRERLINYLRAAGINVLVRGRGWPEGHIESDEEMIDIINRSKICLSLNTPAFYFGWRPIASLFFRRARLGEGGFRVKLDIWNFFGNLRLWLDKRNAQVKSRHFDVPACGTMEMTQDADDLKDYYKLGEEIVVYKDNKDLVEKIKYYLAHPEEREAIAGRGYERTIREHSKKKRFEDIFGMIGKPL
jgi:spore maturation protein CgeB